MKEKKKSTILTYLSMKMLANRQHLECILVAVRANRAKASYRYVTICDMTSNKYLSMLV